MKFRPLHDRVVVRRLNAEEKTAGGIIIPDTAQEKPMEGEVIAAGAGARNEAGQIVALDVKAGDRVLFGKWSPALTSSATMAPASLRAPAPAAITSPSIGFSWAVSGMMMPPLVFSSASRRRMTTLSCSGRNFMGSCSWASVMAPNGRRLW